MDRGVQEVVLSPTKVAMFGKTIIPWESLHAMRSHFELHRWGCCHDWWRETMSNLGRPYDRHHMQPLFYYLDMVSQHVGWMHYDSGKNLSPVANLWEYRIRESSDPRDKVIGLLGLNPSWELGRRDINYVLHHGDYPAVPPSFYLPYQVL
ncbi:hypothetical protein VMCG_06253 [Cytospora schulzeri]|uniref:Uncharacterized protein n=1 Tax=Cytospora schulzeri TaxID=448051 RepID=A0A423W9F4_9PEZI|nr:hypothetical protein VMCG_06253 [Valsa malicola]